MSDIRKHRLIADAVKEALRVFNKADERMGGEPRSSIVWKDVGTTDSTVDSVGQSSWVFHVYMDAWFVPNHIEPKGLTDTGADFRGYHIANTPILVTSMKDGTFTVYCDSYELLATIDEQDKVSLSRRSDTLEEVWLILSNRMRKKVVEATAKNKLG